MKHPNILRLYTCLEDTKFFYLVLEYTAEGNLFNWIRKVKAFTEHEAAFFFIQTVVGFYYMHKNGFIHRDLKPENLLVFKSDQSYSVKICDFTWTLELEEKLDGMEERKTFCGTFEYMAPEMLNEETHNYQIDVWSLGILLFELVHGHAPFRGTNQMTVKTAIKKKIAKIPFKDGLSKEYKDLVYQFLTNDCNQRIPLIKVFVHPWVKKFED